MSASEVETLIKFIGDIISKKDTKMKKKSRFIYAATPDSESN